MLTAAALALGAVSCLSLLAGAYPLTLAELLGRGAEPMARRVFWTLRLPRTVMAVFGGFGLGAAGHVYQTVFRNPLAAPDIIGVSSGASAGAAVGILFLSSSAAAVTLSAFGGGLAAVLLALALALASAARRRGSGGATLVLAGIVVHALAQTLLMALKLTADPERQLASIEYWIMGSLNGVTLRSLPAALTAGGVGLVGMFLLHRHILMLTLEDEEARLLGLSVGRTRLAALLLATLTAAAVISVTGLISFIGLLAPHIARLLLKDDRLPTLALAGLMGGILLCGADILARTVSANELPVSIFTSLLGAPFLLGMMFKRGEEL